VSRTVRALAFYDGFVALRVRGRGRRSALKVSVNQTLKYSLRCEGSVWLEVKKELMYYHTE
jgi:hypothetical protein